MREAEPKLGELTPDVEDLLSDPTFTAALQETSTVVAVAYAEAMLAAQVFEFAAKLAYAALLAGPPADDRQDETSAAMRTGLGRSIERLRGLTGSEHDDLIALLDQARGRRNHLAHSFWMPGFVDLFAGRSEELVAALAADRELFESALERLFATVLLDVVHERSLSVSDINTVGSVILTAEVLRPDVLSGLNLIEDTDEVLDRLLVLVRETNA